jgi:hypothetical protein
MGEQIVVTRTARTILCGLLAAIVPAIEALAQHRLPAGSDLGDIATLRDGRSMRVSSTDPNPAGNADNRQLEPGQTIVLAEIDGPGIITHIWNTISSAERGHPRLLTLRMYWDGEANPSVESPIGDFFGIGHGMSVPYSSEPVAVSSDGRGRNCYWPMPFRKSAKITLTNDGRLACGAFYYYIDWRKVAAIPEDTGYFHAMYRQEHPATKGKNYMLADITGRGHYVGTVLSVRQHIQNWWGEGDDFFYIDGEEKPSLMGTGTEDYFCDGWGFRTFSFPYYGAPLSEPLISGSRHSVYRWHIPDPIVFQKSLRAEIEHIGVTYKENGEVASGAEERFDDFSSVAYWYQIEPHTAFAPLPAGKDRLYIDPEAIVQGEELVSVAKVTGGTVEKQELKGAQKEAHLWWRTDKPEQSLELPVKIPETGTYELTLILSASKDYGAFEVQLDGMTIVKSVDTYNPNVVFGESTIFDLPIEAGDRTLRFVNRGKNDRSAGYLFGLDGYHLRRVPAQK